MRKRSVKLPVITEEYKNRFGSEYFEKYYGGYPEDVFGARAVIRAAELLKVFSPESVLVIGCAYGYLVDALRIAGVDAYGIDISEFAIGRAKLISSWPSVLVEGCVTDLKMFKSDQFDLVVAFDILDRLPLGSVKKAIEEVARVARRYIVLSVALNRNDNDPEFVLSNGEQIFSRMSSRFWIRNFEDYGCKRIGFKWGSEDDYTMAVLFFEKSQTVNQALMTKKKTELVKIAKRLGIEGELEYMEREELIALIILKNKELMESE